MNDYSESLGWPIKDPGWIGKIIVQGLIYLIPIVGWMALYGWMLAALDNLRQGRRELPAAGFGHLGRGVTLFLVLIVYGLAIAVVFCIFLFIGFALIAAGSNSNSGVLSALGVILTLFAYLLAFIASLAFYFLIAPVIVATERGGFGGGLNIMQVVAMARTNLQASIFAGLFILVGHLIGSLGGILCGIGIILTVAYGFAVMAGVVSIYERQLGQQPLPPLQPAAPAV